MGYIIILSIFTGGWMIFSLLIWIFVIRHESKHNKPKPDLLRKYRKLRKVY
jgi:hypothetical protein